MVKRFLIIILVCVAIVLGTPTERQSLLRKRIDPYTVEVYKYGITLNNGNRLFYNVSPYNFSFVSGGVKKPVLEWSENISPKEFDYGQKIPYKQIYSILTFFNIVDPRATFVKNPPIVLNTKSTEREIEISHNLRTEEFDTLTQTLSFNDSDIVFSPSYKVFTEISDLEIEEFSRFYGVAFTKSESDVVTDSAVIVSNLEHGGAFIVDLTQFDAVRVNTIDGLVEFTSNNKSLPIKLKIYNNLQEVINDLR